LTKTCRDAAWRRNAFVAVALTLAIGATSCGDDDVKNSSGAPIADGGAAAGVLPNPDHKIPDPTVHYTKPTDGIQEIVNDIQDGLLTLRGRGVCIELTDAGVSAITGQKEVAGEVAAPVTIPECVEAVTRALHTPELATRRRLRSKVVAFNPGRRSGIATIETPGRPTIHLRLVKEDGAWKVPRVDLHDPTGLPADVGR
jgi:hypothetical protein